MRSLTSLVTIVIVISCAVSSTRAQTCFSNTTKLNATAVVGVAHYLITRVYNFSSLGSGDSLGYLDLNKTVQICTTNFNTEADNVTALDIGTAAMAIIKECCPNAEDCEGGIYAYTGPTQYGLLSYVVPFPDSNYSACPGGPPV